MKKTKILFLLLLQLISFSLLANMVYEKETGGKFLANGIKPTIGINNLNRVVEIHVSQNENKNVWYRLGYYSEYENDIIWADNSYKIDKISGTINTGMLTQQVAINDNGKIVYLYAEDDNPYTNNFHFIAGTINSKHPDQITWKEPVDLGVCASERFFNNDYNYSMTLDNQDDIYVGSIKGLDKYTFGSDEKSEIVKSKYYETQDETAQSSMMKLPNGAILMTYDDDNSDWETPDHEGYCIYYGDLVPVFKNLPFKFDGHDAAISNEYVIITFGDDDKYDSNDCMYVVADFSDIYNPIWGKMYRYDTGIADADDSNMRIAANEKGLIVEIHQHQSEEKLYYNVGKLRPEYKHIEWRVFE
jgi:hypothetical protein